jgi:hypothetical protein
MGWISSIHKFKLEVQQLGHTTGWSVRKPFHKR